MHRASTQLVPNVGTLVILGLFLAMQATGVFGAPNQLQVADVPTTIGYQGQLTDGTGNPVSDGTYTMRFCIYDDATSGTALWTEYQDVTVIDGQFDVLLGSVTSLSGSVFDSSQRWLAIQVDADPEMAPRQPLSSVPFALRADVADASITTAKIANGAVTQEKLAGDLDFLSETAGSYTAQIVVSEGTDPSVTPSTIELTYKRIGSVVFVSFPYSTLTIAGSPHVMHISLPFPPEANNRGGDGDLTYSGGGQIGDVAGMMVSTSMLFRHVGAGFPNGEGLYRMGFWYIAAPE